MMDAIIFQWTGTTNVDPDGRNGIGVFDGRKLGSLEALSGNNYAQYVQGPAAVDILNAEYERFKNYITAQLLSQTEYKELFALMSVSYNFDTEVFEPDFSSIADSLKDYIAIDDTYVNGALGVLNNLTNYSTPLQNEFQALKVDSELGSYAYAADIIDGSHFGETITGGDTHDAIRGNGGHDTLLGGAGDDQYLFNIGDGLDTIGDTSGFDGVFFGDNITLDSLRVTGEQTNLVITILNGNGQPTSDKIQIANVFPFDDEISDLPIEYFRFSDNSTVTLSELISNHFDQQATEGSDSLYSFSAGADLRGLGGNDYLYISQGGSAAYGDAGDDFLQAASGNDQLYGGEGDDQLRGDDGNDTLFGGAGIDNVIGGDGDDIIEGGTGNDRLFGQAGNDTFVFNIGDGVDVLFEEYGDNTISFGAGISLSSITSEWVAGTKYFAVSYGENDILNIRDGIAHTGFSYKFADNTVVDASTFIEETIGHSLAITIPTDGNGGASGSMFNDRLVGNYHANDLYGQAGDDVLYGLEGSDALAGGTGNDELRGDHGNDIYIFNRGDGQDTILESTGTDQISFGDGIKAEHLVLSLSGTDLVLTLLDAIGNATSDSLIIRGGLGSNTIEFIVFSDNQVIELKTLASAFTEHLGTEIDDTINGTVFDDTIYGLGGSDIILARDGGQDQIYGGDGDDRIFTNNIYWASLPVISTVFGERGNDYIVTGDQEDYVSGGLGDDFIQTGLGNDVIQFNLGDGEDELRDQGGIDKIVFGGGITQSQIEFTPVDYFSSGRYEDISITINDENGDATGDSILLYQAFADSNYNIETIEFIDGSFITKEDIFTSFSEGVLFQGTSVSETMVGLDGNDFIFSYAGNDIIRSGEGNDTIDVGEGDDVVYAGDGDDVITATSGGTAYTGNNVINGEGGNDTITVGADDDWVDGGDGNDHIDLGAGNDTVYGGAGDDVIQSSYGNNVVTGGSGNDVIDLGRGNDIIQFYLGDGKDVVRNFLGTDKIFFGQGITMQNIVASRQNDDLSLTIVTDEGFATGDSLTIENSFYDSSRGIELIQFSDESIIRTDELPLAAINEAPVISQAIADQSTLEAEVFSFALPAGSFTDADVGDVLTYSATLSDNSPLPSWLSFDASTQTFSGTPTNADVGVLSLNVTATDQGDLSVSDTFDLTVTNVNEAPVLSQAIADQSTLEAEVFSFALPAGSFTDADVGDVLTYSVSLANDSSLPSWLSFDANTQTFSGTPGSENIGVLNLKVIATDRDGLSVSDTFDLTVTNVNEAPVLSQAIPDQSIQEAQAFNFALPAGSFTDPDVGDVLTYSATLSDNSPLPSWLSFDTATQTFSGTPGSGDVGVISLKVTVIDQGGLSVSDEFDLTVESQFDITGTEGDDVLTGTGQAESIHGYAGADNIKGKGGKDIIYGGQDNDIVNGGGGHDTLFGNEDKDKLIGGGGNDLLEGGAGNDILIGSKGNDRYVFSADSGFDKVNNNDTSLTSFDVAQFNDVSYEDLWFSKKNNHLEVTIAGTDDKVRFNNWYKDESDEIDQFEVGKAVLLNNQIDQLVSSMAAYDVPAGVGNVIPQETKDVLQPILTQSWQAA